MKRRSFVFLSGAALPSIGQTQRVMRLGHALPYPLASLPASSYFVVGITKFLDDLKRLGWEEGRNLIVERRYTMGDAQKYGAIAEEFVAARVDVIFVGIGAALAATYKATKTVPIVAMASGLVESGYAKSLAHPGGNVTGVEIQGGDGTAKTFDLLYAIQPGLKRIGYAERRDVPGKQSRVEGLQAVAAAKGVSVVLLPDANVASEVEPMLAAAKRERIQGLYLGVGTNILEGPPAQRIQDWATENKVVTASGNWFQGQLLLGRGPDIGYLLNAAARAIDRIFRGAKPADIPIEQAMRVEVIVNQKLAKAIGLTIPHIVLLQATEVIE